MFLLKSYYLCITNKEITQIPKSESKKFSILCTFKAFCVNVSVNVSSNSLVKLSDSGFGKIIPDPDPTNQKGSDLQHWPTPLSNLHWPVDFPPVLDVELGLQVVDNERIPGKKKKIRIMTPEAVSNAKMLVPIINSLGVSCDGQYWRVEITNSSRNPDFLNFYSMV